MTVIHQRTLIRRQVLQMLSGNTDAATRVYSTRVRPVQKEKLPAICVYTLEDDPSDVESEAPLTLIHHLNLVTEVIVQGVDEMDDYVDSVCAQVENALMIDDRLGETAIFCKLGKTTIEPIDEGSGTNLSARIQFDVQYRSCWPEEAIMAPQLSNLDGVDSKIGDATQGQTEIDSTVNFTNS